MHRLFITFSLVAFLSGMFAGLPDQKHQTVYDFSLVDINGKTVPLSTYKGKVLLIVNLASQSTYRDQISALNDLQNTYSAQGLVVIGIPSSDFGAKELTDTSAVRQYYSDKLHVDFPLFAPAKTQGVEAIPLYTFLCDPKIRRARRTAALELHQIHCRSRGTASCPLRGQPRSARSSFPARR